LALFLLLFGSGCASIVKEKQKLEIPQAHERARTATFDELVSLINERYAGIESLVTSRFEVEFHGGSAQLGFIERYPRAKGYLAAKLPAAIYVNILNPLTNSTVVTMASREGEFQIWSPRDNKYLVGRTDIRLEDERPLFNVRPHHLLRAILVEPVPVDDPDFAVFLEEDQDPSYKYYILNVLRRTDQASPFCLARKVWIERSEMRMRRQQYYDCGVVVSNIRYGQPVERDGFLISTEVDVRRLKEHYRMVLTMESGGLEVNREIKDERFAIPRPAGAELVVVKENEG
jgi:hypothetical protein